MKNWFKRLIALTMTGAIMAGSVTALAVEQNVTVAEAQTPPTGFDDEEAEGYKDISILKVENDPNDNITVYSSIYANTNYSITLYCAEKSGEYKTIDNVEYGGDDQSGNCEAYISGLTNGKFYSFKLALVFDGKEIAYSKPVSICRLKRVAFNNEPAVVRNRRVTLKWSRNSKADGYLIQCYKQGSKATTKKNFWVRNNKTRSKVLTGLSSKYSTVSIKAYKKVNGKTYYSYADTTGLITG